jgi:hypothetical protein
MNPYLANFANMARPGRGPAPMLGRAAPPPGAGMAPTVPQGMPQQPPRPVAPRIDPSRVVRPMSNLPINQAAAAGRGGDSMMAHMTPGEIAVPPEVQTPEVLAALNRAFAERGTSPNSYQAGNSEQKINPETGAPEFGFFDLNSLLPLALSIGGSALLGPEFGAAIEGLGVGADTAGIVGGALGSGLGSTAGNLIGGKDFGEALGTGALSGLGSGIGGYIGNAFGTGATPMDTTGPIGSDGIRNIVGMADLPGGGLSSTGMPLTLDTGTVAADTSAYPNLISGGGLTAADSAAAAKPESSIFGKLISKQGIGSGIGGALGGAVAEDLYRKPVKTSVYDPKIPTKPLSAYVGSGYGTPVFPTRDDLLNNGGREWNYYPNG